MMELLGDLDEGAGWTHLLIVAALCYFCYIHFPWKDGDKQSGPPMVGKAGDVNEQRNFLKRMKDKDKNCIIFFGSQTGTAEAFAARLAKEGKQRFGLNTMVADLEKYDYGNLDQVPDDKVVIFLLATYGEGEPTDNATGFFEFISSEEPSFSERSSLRNLNYAAFGLGNHDYENFNFVVRQVTKSLNALGASLIGAVGEGDEGSSTTEDDFMAWKESLWVALAAQMNLQEVSRTNDPSFLITETSELCQDSARVYLGEPNERWRLSGGRAEAGPFGHANPYAAPISASKVLTSSKDKDRQCLHVEVDISGTGLTYQTGDHLAVWPSNSNVEVDRLLDVLELRHKRHQVIQVQAVDSLVKVPFPTPTTYDSLFRYYLEICAPVSRQLISELVPFLDNEKIQNRLSLLSKDRDLFHAQSHFLNLGQFLQSIGDGAKWSGIPFSLIVEGLPSLQHRFYSISSSSLLQPTKISITVAVKSKTIPGPNAKYPFYGVASNFILALHNAKHHTNLSCFTGDMNPLYDIRGPRGCYLAERLPIHIRKSKFRLPDDPQSPVIMIGSGTGVAPFRGFVQERAAIARSGRAIGKMLLCFGCRRRDEDFLYEQEWKQYEQEVPSQFKLITAFSRETPEKVYVQHRLRQLADELDELLQRGASLYVCGDAAHMASEVNHTLATIISTQRGVTMEDSAAILKDMRAVGRYQEDVWA